MIHFIPFYKRIFYVLLSIGMAILILSPESQKTPIKWLSLPVGTAVYSLQIGTNSFFKGAREIWNGYIHLTQVEKENRQLRKTIAEMEGAHNRLKEKGLLADRLQALLNYQNHTDIQTTAAAVIGRKPSQWFDTIMINKGQSAGIAVDMGVIAPQGVVGKVIHVGPHYAQVLLSTDRNSAISATVQRTREKGIVQGNDAGSARLKYLPHDAKLAIGDLLMTSGMEGSFSKGLPIGEIKAIEGREEEMFLKIDVAFNVDVNNIEEVLVIQSIEDRQP